MSNNDFQSYGMPHRGDNPFTRRMRFHQSWYRERILHLPFDPQRGYGNYLSAEDGNRGKNFLSSQIFAVVTERINAKVGAVASGRLLQNMLSSQPMCFNLFGPLVGDTETATRLFQALLPNEIKRVNRVSFEWAPSPTSDYLNDRTAFDAFVDYQRCDGKRGFIGIETKLTEPFTQKVFSHAEPSYRMWTQRSDSPWPQESWSALANRKHHQLRRDHLLVEALRVRNAATYSAGKLLVVHHPADAGCKEVMAGYRQLLKAADTTFLSATLADIITILKNLHVSSNEQWIAAFEQRYLDLEVSADDWDRSLRSKRP